MAYVCGDCDNVIEDDVMDHALVPHYPNYEGEIDIEATACASHDAIGCSLCGTYM